MGNNFCFLEKKRKNEGIKGYVEISRLDCSIMAPNFSLWKVKRRSFGSQFVVPNIMNSLSKHTHDVSTTNENIPSNVFLHSTVFSNVFSLSLCFTYWMK